MIKNLSLTLAALALVASPTLASAETPAEKGLALAKRLDAANAGFKTDISDMQMDLINAQGDVVKRKMTIQTIEGAEGDKSIAAFSWPADVNGTKLLTWTHKAKTDDQWLFLPAIKRIKRISARNKSGSFMGSEFAYEDLASQEIEKYTYKFLREEDVNGRKAWVSERYPSDKRSGYARQITWSDQEYMSPLKIEYYDRKNELLKTSVFTGYSKFGKYWRWAKIDVTNHQTKKRSVLEWKNRKLGTELDEEDFDSDSLED